MKTFKTYEKEIIEVIKKNNLFVINDIFAFYSGCVRETFYKRKLNLSDNIKKAIDDNKIKTKQSMKNKWFKSDNATLQMGLMKLLGSDEEAHRLNGTKTENKNTNHNSDITLTDAEIKKEINRLRGNE